MAYDRAQTAQNRAHRAAIREEKIAAQLRGKKRRLAERAIKRAAEKEVRAVAAELEKATLAAAWEERKELYILVYVAAHKDEIAAYIAARKDKQTVRSHKRRALKYSAPVNDLTAAQWRAIKEHFNYLCAYCGRKPEQLTQDHVIPLIKGGNHTSSNVVPACRSCNSKKGAGAPPIPVETLSL